MDRSTHEDGLHRVTNDEVWQETRLLFLVAALVFLVSVGFGFLNAVTTGSLPRWQLLTHLHAGTVGWITLSVLAVTVWLFTGDREVTDRHVRRVRLLSRSSIVAFVGLVASFAVAFSQGGATMYLVPVFGAASALLIWATAGFALSNLRDLPVVTTTHLLVTAGLVVGSVGVTVGALVGLNNASGILPFAHDIGVGGHQASVETYLLLVGSGLVEWFVRRGADDGWSKAGAVQAGVGTVAGLVAPTVLLLSVAGLPRATIEPLFFLMILGWLVFALVFLARIGRHALLTNPLDTGTRAWAFFATVWLFVYVGSFFAAGALGSTDWLTILTLHALFVGLMTNLLLGVLAVRTRRAAVQYPWAEPAAIWLLNGGIVVFVALKATTGSRLGAMVMGTGALVGVGAMLLRLRRVPRTAVRTSRADERVAE